LEIKGKYAIAGVGFTPQGRIPGRTALSFHLEACAEAIKDAGLKKEEIDGLICYRYFPPLAGEDEVTPYLVAQHLGLSPKALSQEANCARSQLFNALGMLESGLCKAVLLSYGDNALSGGRPFDLPHSYKAAFGHFGAVADYAMAARRAMHEFRTGPKTWKEIALSQRRWANLNPAAVMYQKPLDDETYLRSPMLVEPFRLLDCCLITDGGRACVITSVERARDLRHPPAVIMGLGQHNPCTDIFQASHMAGSTGAKEAGARAFEMAGITPQDVVYLHRGNHLAGLRLLRPRRR